MFNNKASDHPPPPKNSGAVETLVGKQTEITGDVRFTGGLHVDGRINGNVTATADTPATPTYLSVSRSAVVQGNVRVAVIVLNGTIVGDVYATEKITLGAKARVNGSVFYKVIEMQSGAQVNGQMVHESMAAAVLGRETVAVREGAKEFGDSRIIDVKEVRQVEGSAG